MNSIIEALYGGGAGSKPKKPSSGSGYYNSFGYYNDQKNDSPPPTADKGGPTALELAQKYGHADDKGMLSNGMHATVAAMYGGGMAPIDASNNSMNPNYRAGLFGDTVGGISNSGAWGEDLNWSTPQGGQAQDGTVFETPLGNYTVSKNPWGQFVLVPQEGAVQSNAPYLTNFTSGGHHLGINPETGEVWYQQAAGFSNFSPDVPSGIPEGDNEYANGNGGGGNGGSFNSGGGGGSTWQEVLNRGGADLESWDPYLGIFTGLGSNPDWTSLSPAQVESTFFNLFGDLANANEVYQRLLENLGLV